MRRLRRIFWASIKVFLVRASLTFFSVTTDTTSLLASLITRTSVYPILEVSIILLLGRVLHGFIPCQCLRFFLVLGRFYSPPGNDCVHTSWAASRADERLMHCSRERYLGAKPRLAAAQTPEIIRHTIVPISSQKHVQTFSTSIW